MLTSSLFSALRLCQTARLPPEQVQVSELDWLRARLQGRRLPEAHGEGRAGGNFSADSIGNFKLCTTDHHLIMIDFLAYNIEGQPRDRPEVDRRRGKSEALNQTILKSENSFIEGLFLGGPNSPGKSVPIRKTSKAFRFPTAIARRDEKESEFSLSSALPIRKLLL